MKKMIHQVFLTMVVFIAVQGLNAIKAEAGEWKYRPYETDHLFSES